jgi:hypothetical protein
VLEVADSLLLVFHEPFLPVHDLLRTLFLLIHHLGRIDFFRLRERKRLLDRRDDTEKQEEGDRRPNDKDEEIFGVFHTADSIK